MRHPAMKEGDTVAVRGQVVSTAADYVGVLFGDRSFRQTVYVPRASIASVDAEPDADVVEALCGTMGRVALRGGVVRAI